MEVFLGNSREKQALRFSLNFLRLFHFKYLREKYYGIHFVPLSQFFLDSSLEQKVNVSLLKKGIENFYKYQETLNEDYQFFPFERVFVGLYQMNDTPDKPFDEFGGYYSKYQTYHHFEQISLMSPIGIYAKKNYNKDLTTLELLRSYFHDSIHFNTFRSYKLKVNRCENDIQFEDIHRLQYGFNFRREDGKSFSNIDKTDAKTTRNLGIVMEGITDDFSKMAVAKIIEDEKIYFSDLSYFENIILNEMISTSFNEVYPSDAFTEEEKKYLNRINEAYENVWKRYYQFLNEFSIDSKQAFRNFIFTTMITGNHLAFKDYFNRQLNDLNGFDNLFKNPCF